MNNGAFSLNADDTHVGKVCCSYLVGHMSNVMQFMLLTRTIFFEIVQYE